jgi:WD40 repeat protein
VSVWDVATGTEVKRLTPAGEAGVVHALAALPDGKRVLVGRSMARLWDVGAGTVAREWPVIGSCDAVAADPTGRFLAGGAPAGETHVWDAETGAIVTRCSTGPGVYVLAFAADGRRLAAGCADGTVTAWVLPAAPAPAPRNQSP